MAEKLKTIVDRLLTGLLGDAEHAEQDRPALMLDLLSDWLPYRVYRRAGSISTRAPKASCFRSRL
jgi:conjugal transfer ATP-binding protein TraC